MNLTEYIYNRLFIENKGLEVLGHLRLIPLFNYFYSDHWKFNAKIEIENKGDIKLRKNYNFELKNILNCDETAVCLNNPGNKTITKIGKKSVL